MLTPGAMEPAPKEGQGVIRDRLKRAARMLLGRPEPQQRPPARPPASATAPSRAADLVRDDDEADIEVDSAMVAEWLAEGRPLTFLDVRELVEMRAGHVEGAHLMPMGQVARRHKELPRDQRVVVYCAAGARSLQISQYLRGQGLDDAWSMVGGLGSWLAQGGKQVVPPPGGHLNPGQHAALTLQAAERLGIDPEARSGTIQEIRAGEAGAAAVVLGIAAPEGGLRRIEGLGHDDLEP